jgi:hypothetical protein
MKSTMIMPLVFVLGAACLAAAQPPAEPVKIGNRLEPLVDRMLIDTLTNTVHALCPVQTGETVLRFDAPWEGRYCGYVTVFRDDSRYRMYYRGLPDPNKDGSETEVTCYAESLDGKYWVKPSLGIFESHGTRENNVVVAGRAPFSHNFSPFYDGRSGVPDAQRYKAIAGTSEKGLATFVSGDGLHWEVLKEAVITKGAFDSQNVAFWSEMEQCYVCYFRSWSEGNFGGFRWISRTTSADFLTWSEPVVMDKGSAPWEHLYTNQTQPYYRAPQLYISVAARFMPGRKVVSDEVAARLGIQGSYGGDCSDNVLMTSRGGNIYDRTFMEGFIRPGLGMENWTSRTNYPACGIVPTGKNEMSVYVQRNYGQPTGHLVRYPMRPDGFASVKATYTGGEMVTKPLLFEGDTLLLNFATSAAGSVRVEVQNADGKPIDGLTADQCDELFGDFLDRPVQWKDSKSLAELAGKPIRLRFLMKDADLYAIRFVKG